MKSYSSRELIKKLKADGWEQVAVSGSHHQFKHPAKPGRVTVPHPGKIYRRRRCAAFFAKPVGIFRSS